MGVWSKLFTDVSDKKTLFERIIVFFDMIIN